MQTNINAIIRVASHLGRRECCPRASVEKGGPVASCDRGNRRDRFPREPGAEGGFRPHRDCSLIYSVDIRKKKRWKVVAFIWAVLLGMTILTGAASSDSPALKGLIITGQHNHDWKASSAALEQILEDTGLFEVETVISPPKGKSMADFTLDFSAYQLIILNYNGDEWPKTTKKAFLDYVRSGGGVVVYHAADNAFPEWKEYRQVIGLGWGKGEQAGPYVFWKDGEAVRDSSPGIAGSHGPQHAFLVVNRDTTHPITRGLPEKWMHAPDELYALLRGPAENIHILSTAYSDPAQLGTGRDEPVLFIVNYGKGRIFHTVLGHLGENSPSLPLECVGFIVTLQRGAEWAATGNVTQKVPGDFPGVFKDYGTPDDVCCWTDYRPPDLEAILQKISTYDYGKDEEVLSRLRSYVRSIRNSREAKAECEAKLAEFLGSKATLASKMAVCRQLSEIGSSASVPVLERMLLKEETSDLARYALEKIPDASAEKALIQALDKTRGKVRLGIVSSLGNRRAEKAAPALEKLVNKSDPATAAAAATALGHIANPQSSDVLLKSLARTSGKVRDRVASSLLNCAQEFIIRKDPKKAAAIFEALSGAKLPLPIRQSAMKGRIRSRSDKEARSMIIRALEGKDFDQHALAISLIGDFFDDSNISEVCALFSGLPAASQIQLLEAISCYQDKSARSTAVEATKNPEQEVRIAALRALEKLGNKSTVELLVMHAAQARGKEQEAARTSLWGMRGKDVDKVILLNLVKMPDPDIQNELIQSVAERRIEEGLELILARARSSDSGNRLEAIKAVKDIASFADLPRLVELLLSTKEERDQLELASTIAVVAGKSSQPVGRARAVTAALSQTEDIPKRCSLFRVLGKIGDDSSLPVLRKALAESNPELKDAAVRALADWPTPTPREDLLQVARTTTNTVHKVLALRAYIQMVGMEPYRSPRMAVHSLQQVLDLSRPEEKKLILGILPTFTGPEALALAESLLKEKEVAAEAELAIKKIKQALKRNI